MKTIKKGLSLILSLCLLMSFFGAYVTASAADVSVEIVSFLRGAQTDLRSSELLEARVTGYDGNIRDLTYKWTNDLGTYLYVYNDHNMYGINATAGEIEIYNNSVKSSSNMKGRSYKNSFSGEGFAWAAVYGADYSMRDLLGTVTVQVYDPDGNLLATDTHTGTREISFDTYSYVYSGFVADDLSADLEAITFGIFEGESKLVKELFSEASIVHITCVESTVEDAVITEGEEFLSLTKNSDGTYSVEALQDNANGETITIEMSIRKDNCKFHKESSGSTTTTVHVYRKPVPVPTTTTISLTAASIDERCTYFINGVQGKEMPDGTVLFEGLTPNTTYTIEAQGHVEGTEVVYAYVPCTTLPVNIAQVVVYLDGYYDTTTATAYGTLVDISDVSEDDNDLYLKAIDGTEYIALEHIETGIYRVGAENGIYNIYHEQDEATIIGNQQLVMTSADRTRYLFYYSVAYDAAGGTGAPETAYYYEGDAAYVSEIVPTNEGYIFAGWQDEDGNIYQPGQLITSAIGNPYKLTAIWEEATDVYVNIELVHRSDDGVSFNNDRDKHNVIFTVDGREGAEGDYIELASKSIMWDGESTFDVEGYTVEGVQSAGEAESTAYLATTPTFTDMPLDMEYTFTSAKSGYELVSVETTTDADGNVVIDATLVFVPTNKDFVYNVTLDEEAKLLPDELKPVAANVKVTSWYDTPYDSEEVVDWHVITQQYETYTKVALDENGEGSASYPVWVATADGAKYHYRIDVVSYVLPDGTIMAANNVGGANEYYTTEDERYSAYVEVTGGAAPEGSTLDGAYFDEEQVGEVTAIISIEVFDVIFDPNGGQFSDNTTAEKLVENQIAIPLFAPYAPTREGGYTFDGWYYEGTDEKAVEGTVLYKDETLVAKWLDPRTIEGTVTVIAEYEENGENLAVYDVDRIYSVPVLLQRIEANGYANTIETKIVDLTYTGTTGTASYSFANVPDDGHEYRIFITGANYIHTFQNEDSASTVVTDYASYDSEHYYSAWGGDSTAMINALMKFNPEVFELQYAIDATAIGDGFRPENVETLVLYDDGSKGTNPQNWQVITQMADGDGQVTALTDGEGANSYPVWEGFGDTSVLYDYSILVTDVDNTAFDAQTAPFMIYYNGSARYDAVEGQTQILTATIVPKMYTITFDVNAEDDTVTGMDNYETTNGSYKDSYYWSYGTEITAQPVRTGYKFLGWKDVNGNTVTEVAPSMHENITLIATWEKATVTYVNNYAYIFGYNDQIMGAEGPLLRSEISAMIHRLVKQNGELGGFVYDESAEPAFCDIEGEWFRSGIEFMNYKGAFVFKEGSNVYPYSQITRGEAFKMVAIGLSFTSETNLTEEEYAQILVDYGYVVGDENGNLNLGDSITRAQFVTLYNRIIERDDAVITDKDGNEITGATYGFTDLEDKSVWYYTDIIRGTSAYTDGFVDIEKRGIRNELDDYAG